MKQPWYNKKWAIVVMHIAAWVILFSLPYLLRPSFSTAEQPPKPPDNSTMKFIVFRINDLMLISFFYLNAVVLFPRLVYRKKYLLYILSVFACFGIILFQNRVLTVKLLHPDPGFTLQKQAFLSFFIFLFILACSIAYRTIRDKISADNIAK